MSRANLARGVALLLSALGVACDGTTTISSRIASADGVPLADATVTVANAPRPVHCTTDSTGGCVLSFLHGGWHNRYELLFSQAGFKEGRTRASAGRKLQCRVSLAAITDVRASGAVCE